VVAVANAPGNSENFHIVRKADDTSRVRIQAPDGRFLQVQLTHSSSCSLPSTWQLYKVVVWIFIL